VRERIQINNEPLSEDKFARYFFETWDRLRAASTQGRDAPDQTTPTPKPAYFAFLTVMAYHVFLSENVDATVLECGIGGELDSTNVIPKPVVSGVTALGIDHVKLLGNTLPQIAWQKAGIFKPGAPAMTVPQPEDALTVLRDRALERNVSSFQVVQPLPRILNGDLKLGLAGEFQKTNASLAVALSAKFLQKRELGATKSASLSSSATAALDLDTLCSPAAVLPEEFVRGLEQVKWPGRCDARPDDKVSNLTWFMDGAHTAESIQVAAEWFVDLSSNTPHPDGLEPLRILVFNQQQRDSAGFLKTLASVCRVSPPAGATSSSTFATTTSASYFAHAIFTTNSLASKGGDLVSYNTDPAVVAALVVQKRLAETWQECQNGVPVNAAAPVEDAENENAVAGADVSHDPIQISPSVDETIARCRRIASEIQQTEPARPVHVLVTGSLHLIGAVLEVLEG